jgi:F-type H+-transporting ATPase subunit a
MQMIITYAPLEQFQILSLVNIFGLNFIFTNFMLINILSLFLFFILFVLISPASSKQHFNKISFYFLPNVWQKGIEFLSETVTNVISDVITKDNERYFPAIATLFHFILFGNLAGLVPYSFTTTSHLIVTFTLSFSVFIGINIITFQKYKMKTFSLFLPANTPFFLALLLVPVEFISYLAKPISLGARLFINLMASHSTLKVIIGFSWSLLLLENALSFGFFIPMLLVVVLFVLELGIALIQTYVFVLLTCIYIQDGS